jgi:hypothetical protein
MREPPRPERLRPRIGQEVPSVPRPQIARELPKQEQF